MAPSVTWQWWAVFTCDIPAAAKHGFAEAIRFYRADPRIQFTALWSCCRLSCLPFKQDNACIVSCLTPEVPAVRYTAISPRRNIDDVADLWICGHRNIDLFFSFLQIVAASQWLVNHCSELSWAEKIPFPLLYSRSSFQVPFHSIAIVSPFLVYIPLSTLQWQDAVVVTHLLFSSCCTILFLTEKKDFCIASYHCLHIVKVNKSLKVFKIALRLIIILYVRRLTSCEGFLHPISSLPFQYAHTHHSLIPKGN